MIGALFSEDARHVEAARNAAHAAELLDAHTYDLILADPRATVAAGQMFADLLCGQRPELKSRTVFITGDVRRETDEWLERLGCRYLHKPFNLRDLRAATGEILNSSRERGVEE
jgi:DNA-binding response OmpR family regulator